MLDGDGNLVGREVLLVVVKNCSHMLGHRLSLSILSVASLDKEWDGTVAVFDPSSL